MKIIRHKMIKEKLPISQCKPGDKININYRDLGRQWMSVSGELTKVKVLPNGKVQIKFLTVRYGRHLRHRAHLPKFFSQKLELSSDVLAERTRKWVSSDGEHAGYVPEETTDIGGITYAISDDATIGERSLIEAAASAELHDVKAVIDSSKVEILPPCAPLLTVGFAFDAPRRGSGIPPIEPFLRGPTIEINLPPHQRKLT